MCFVCSSLSFRGGKKRKKEDSFVVEDDPRICTHVTYGHIMIISDNLPLSLIV